jgi:UDP-2,3-diacylglucosamine pyrophosphatase LpxH
VSPKLTLDELIYAVQSSPFSCYLLGDIVDIANCRYKDLDQALKDLKMIAGKTNYCRGNHECNAVDAPDEILIWDQVLLTHGDYASWGKERSDKFRNKKWGASWFKRNFISKPIDALRRFKEAGVNENNLQYLFEAKKRYPNLRYVIHGHGHPGSIIHYEAHGVKVLMLPQGISDIGIEL